jgi:hypothetical protein
VNDKIFFRLSGAVAEIKDTVEKLDAREFLRPDWLFSAKPMSLTH